MNFPPEVEERLRSEPIMWMTTVTPDGRPQPSPIWFLWSGADILMFSKADTARLTNIGANPYVSLNLDGDGRGGAIVVIEGSARINREHPPAEALPEYIEKYQSFLDDYGWTAKSFSVDYPVPILIQPKRLRAW
ncbi:MAG TPA: TIGR03667 family PPOX class F420-dependent oxidoreductase [Acidimicrobiia bacterium]|nr:TIGR03667 family PPOX class F420-dependent oxidoreductase [Acidimicrobiia bacterium]